MAHEQESLRASDLHALLRNRTGTPRQLRLFACACCRRIWQHLPHQSTRDLVVGSAILVWETRLALAILREETEFVVAGLHLAQPEGNTRGEQRRDPDGGAGGEPAHPRTD